MRPCSLRSLCSFFSPSLDFVEETRYLDCGTSLENCSFFRPKGKRVRFQGGKKEEGEQEEVEGDEEEREEKEEEEEKRRT